MQNQETDKPRYSTLHYGVRAQLDISWPEYVLLDMVYHLSAKYGYCNKSLSAIANDMGLHRSNVGRTVQRLIDRELLIQVDDGLKCSTAYIDVAYLEKPAVAKRNKPLQNATKERCKTQHRVAKRTRLSQNATNNRGENNNRNTIELINTDVLIGEPPDFGKPEINQMYAFWELTVGYPIVGKVKPNRNACSNLLKRYKQEGLMKLIEYVHMAHQDQFAGGAKHIADFCDLQTKQSELNRWLKTKASEYQTEQLNPSVVKIR